MAALAPEAGFLQAPEGRLGRRRHPVVRADDAVLEILCEPQDAPDVAGVVVGGEAVDRVVGTCHDLFFGIEGQERRHGAERLLLCHEHRVVGICDDRRGKKFPPPLAAPFTRSPPRSTFAPFSRASATWRSTLSMAFASIRGPTSTPSSIPSPTFIAASSSVSRFANSSMTSLWTKMRLAQTHVCPMLRIFEATAPSTAASRSASSKTMNGAWPPSSRLRRFIVSAAWRIRSLPTSVEPVKESLRILRS